MERFNRTTQQLRKKSSKPNRFFLEMLQRFVETTIIDENYIKKDTHYKKLREGLVFFLGSMFYPS